jgi:membrane protease YdiL (CAAX protease family)
VLSQTAAQPARREDDARRAGDVVFAVAACTVLTWYNNVAGRTPWHRRWYPAVNAGATAITLAAAVASGLTADDLGLRRARLRAGLRLGVMASGPIAAALALAPFTPARTVLHDQRVAGLNRRQLAYQVLLRIPVGTVCWEEVAFRAVLPAALRRVLPRRAAMVAASALFGLWHVRPTAEAFTSNQFATGRSARIAGVGAVVAATSAAGAFLSYLGERSDSLAAPVIVHLTANCAGPLASAVNARVERRVRPGRIRQESR